MRAIKYEENDFEELVDFNSKVYPKRNEIRESLDYRLRKSPFSEHKKSYISRDKNGKIVGQFILLVNNFRYNKQKELVYWGMDYIVDEEYRGSLAGSNLCKKALKEKYQFGLGLSEVSLKMHQIFGDKIIGYVSKKIKFNNLFSLIKSQIFKGNFEKVEFPDNIQNEHIEFNKIDNPDLIKSSDGFWNSEYLEFGRSSEFLRWRFFYYPNKYAVYIKRNKDEKENSVYFVVRQLKWKNLNSLLLVDYRYNTLEDYQDILKAVSTLGKKEKFAVTVTNSSLPETEAQLKKNGYFTFGKKAVMVSNMLEIPTYEDHSSEKIIFTFADSDSDFYYSNDQW